MGDAFCTGLPFFVQPRPIFLLYNSLPLLQIVDVAISLAKVADIDRNLGDEDTAVEGFQEGIKLLQSLKLKPEEVSLEQRVILIHPLNLSYTSLVYLFYPANLIWSRVCLQRLSVLEFLNSQLENKQT